MRTYAGLLAAALLLALPAVRAQTILAASSAPPPPRSGLPPPGIDDPGVKSAVPLPSTGIPPSEAPAARAANGAQAPTVTVHKEANGDTVEEYRRGGDLYMVRITPAHGPTQTFISHSVDGRLTRDPRQGPVDPVYYTLYQWDKPPTPAGGESGGE